MAAVAPDNCYSPAKLAMIMHFVNCFISFYSQLEMLDLHQGKSLEYKNYQKKKNAQELAGYVEQFDQIEPG